MRRLIRIALVVIVLAAVLIWAFRPAPVSADFAVVERGSLQVTVDEEGRTRVRDRYVVSAPLPGRMARIELEPGDRVIAGKTVVARLQPTDPTLLDARTRAELEARVRASESAIGSARAERDRIQADLTFARAELKRAQGLLAGGAIARRDLEAAEQQARALERALQSAEFAIQTAGHQREVARASLVQTRSGRATTVPLYSPVDGVVLRLVLESESVVAVGQQLLEVGDVTDLEIVSDLLSSAAVAVRPGQTVLIEQWGGGQALQGRVRRVEPSAFTKISALGVEEQRVNVLIDFENGSDALQSLGDGYRVEVRIIVWSKDDVLRVPTSSLFRHEGEWAVYRVIDGVARRQLVQIGLRNGLEAEVLNGLAAGEQIVVYPGDAIADGVKLTARS
ncbi:MAG TPA: efflux RND transporter periplasmic adaptor subunit [Vicinamibacterales bacterium]|nr:efflux RND transporter periplasmic adaptor subunit [Vicinamibacterales bacterium]